MSFFSKAVVIFAIIQLTSSDALAPTSANFLRKTPWVVEKIEKRINHEDVLWMAFNIYHEARNQSRLGKIAVGVVTLNRKREDQNVHAVVTSPMQFSWYNQHLKNKNVKVPKESPEWNECLEIAKFVLTLESDHDIMVLFNGATHFHTTKVNPTWKKSMTKVVQIDDHIFYRKK